MIAYSSVCIVVGEPTVLPVIFEGMVHEVRVSDSIHGGNKDLLYLPGHWHLGVLDEIIPVLPFTFSLLLINKNNMDGFIFYIQFKHLSCDVEVID